MAHAHSLPAIDAMLADGAVDWLPLVFLPLLALALVLYLAGCVRLARVARFPHTRGAARPADATGAGGGPHGRSWPRGRTGCFLLGLALAALAFLPPLSTAAHADLRAHMLQHLLLGMLAPLALVLGAPISLLLRSLPRRAARICLSVLHSRVLSLLRHPLSALTLNLGGMYLLYLTPLFEHMAASPALHLLVHLHFLLAGYLFCWAVLAGPDPAPRPASPGLRLGVLFAGMAGHAILGKLMYAQGLPRAWPREQVEAAAQWMYYGGDLAEILLLAVLFSFWRRGRGAPAGLFLGGRSASDRERPVLFASTSGTSNH